MPRVHGRAKRIAVRAYDVGHLLVADGDADKNVVGLWLSSGWSGFTSVNPGVVDMYNSTAAPIAFVKCTMQRNGADAVVFAETGSQWRASESDTAHIGLWRNGNCSHRVLNKPWTGITTFVNQDV